MGKYYNSINELGASAMEYKLNSGKCKGMWIN
jgi:hypothetical protein